MNDNLYFNLLHLENYAIIEKPCTLIIRNNSKLDFDNLYAKEENARWLLNLRAITDENLLLLKKISKKKISLTYRDVGHLLMTGALWEDQIESPEDLPAKGENVIVVFDFVDEILRCTSITLIPRKIPKLYKPSLELYKELKAYEEIIKNLEDE